MAQAFLLWGILVIVIAVLCFLVWKFLCTRTGYENKGTVMAWGMGTIGLLIASVLFMPLMTLQLDSAIENIIDEVQNKVCEQTKAEFKPLQKESLTAIIDGWLSDKGIEETDEIAKQKKIAVDNAIKYSENKTVKESIETALKLFKIEGAPVLIESQTDILNAAHDAVKPVEDAVKKEKLPIPSMEHFFHKVVDLTPVSSITGEPADSMAEASLAKHIRTKLSKFFIITATVASLFISILLFSIILLLKDPKERADELEERKYLFEFDRRNKTTGKTISEEINQYN